MKRFRIVLKIVCVLIVVFILFACASAPQKAAIKETESIDFSAATDTSPENIDSLCYIGAETNIKIINLDGNSLNNDWLIVDPGHHLLTIQYKASGVNIDPVKLACNFEEGKYYFIGYEIDKIIRHDVISGASSHYATTIRFSITESNKPELQEEARKRLAIRKAFLAFSNENPDYLEGTWTYSKRYPPVDTKIEFSKNSFLITGYNIWSKRTSKTEGKYFFNENTIVLLITKQDNKNVDKTETIYYELNNGVLNINGGKYVPDHQ